MKHIVLFGGTTEGRKIIEYCEKNRIPLTACVATDYGRVVLPELNTTKLQIGRMNEAQMETFLTEEDANIVLDATHPYAQEVTSNLCFSCEKLRIQYLRIIREEEPCIEGSVFRSIDEVVEYLCRVNGKAMITTGSKEIEKYIKIPFFEERLFFRILPSTEALEQCRKYRIPEHNIIAEQGPFTEEQNYQLLKKWNVKYLVTKLSGKVGGLEEKRNAAKRAEVELLMIQRPQIEQGKTWRELLSWLENTIVDE